VTAVAVLVVTLTSFIVAAEKANLDAPEVSAVPFDLEEILPGIKGLMVIKLGKHVYCEKPLVHHIAEARALGDAARQSKVATQMGNQGSGTGGHQMLAEWLAAGAIGKLREVRPGQHL
jgi:hypothetical protein